jgi:hypothetical protein
VYTYETAGVWLDLTRWGVLGYRAHDVYRALSAAPQRVGLLAVVPPVPRATLYRVLARLAAQGLAVRTPRGWARGPADPREVALRLGLLVRRAHERRRVARERELYRDRLRGPRRVRVVVRSTTP